ncbi:hypothetical protein [Arthrobacter cupressi]|nr:hypothetical protein [Arthrobacter cupressi]NYD78909.1 hypothetical protein [Arthrobacter cupressi]
MTIEWLGTRVPAGMGQEIAEGRCRGMMAGWAYLLGAIMTIDALLLGLLLMNVKWPKHLRKD